LAPPNPNPTFLGGHPLDAVHPGGLYELYGGGMA
jgi:hypothetical protein